MKTFIATAALAAFAAAETHWAVIMAGSNSYLNYRHQADSHHAVKIMLENGIPRENIIHLAYDDIAHHEFNYYPGQIFNKPTGKGEPGRNVYDSSEIDYRGSQVTAQNFYNVLLGNTSNGPALKSDENSKVFVYFADHGATGFICVPEGNGDYIYADDLGNVLQQMKDKKMFKELTFYVEACYSGTMFPTLSADENIYAFTATDTNHSSYAAYCGADAYVDGKYMGACLGDLFSINWLEDTESHSVWSETLAQQYANVKKSTNLSPVQ